MTPRTGYVYVADINNNRIYVFDAWGDFVNVFGWGVVNGTGNLAFWKGLRSIATATSTSSMRGNQRVQKFDSDGNLYVSLGYG